MFVLKIINNYPEIYIFFRVLNFCVDVCCSLSLWLWLLLLLLKMRSFVLLCLLFSLLGMNEVMGVSLEIGPGQEECLFLKEVEKETALRFRYQVVDGGAMDIDVAVCCSFFSFLFFSFLFFSFLFFSFLFFSFLLFSSLLFSSLLFSFLFFSSLLFSSLLFSSLLFSSLLFSSSLLLFLFSSLSSHQLQKVYEPDGQKIHQELKRKEGKFVFKTRPFQFDEYTYKFCLSNKFSTVTSKIVSFSLHSGTETGPVAKRG